MTTLGTIAHEMLPKDFPENKWVSPFFLLEDWGEERLNRPFQKVFLMCTEDLKVIKTIFLHLNFDFPNYYAYDPRQLGGTEKRIKKIIHLEILFHNRICLCKSVV